MVARNRPMPSRSVFADDDEDADGNLPVQANRRIVQIGGLSSEQLDQQIASCDVFDYDGAYDSFSAAIADKSGAGRGSVARPETRVQNLGKSKYIGNLKAAAVVRDKEKERAYERKLLRERETEGGEEGPKFVTQAYREKLAQDKLLDYEDRYFPSALLTLCPSIAFCLHFLGWTSCWRPVLVQWVLEWALSMLIFSPKMLLWVETWQRMHSHLTPQVVCGRRELRAEWCRSIQGGGRRMTAPIVVGLVVRLETIAMDLLVCLVTRSGMTSTLTPSSRNLLKLANRIAKPLATI